MSYHLLVVPDLCSWKSVSDCDSSFVPTATASYKQQHHWECTRADPGPKEIGAFFNILFFLLFIYLDLKNEKHLPNF